MTMLLFHRTMDSDPGRSGDLCPDPKLESRQLEQSYDLRVAPLGRRAVVSHELMQQLEGGEQIAAIELDEEWLLYQLAVGINAYIPLIHVHR
jgi:hypothetical protein